MRHMLPLLTLCLLLSCIVPAGLGDSLLSDREPDASADSSSDLFMSFELIPSQDSSLPASGTDLTDPTAPSPSSAMDLATLSDLQGARVLGAQDPSGRTQLISGFWGSCAWIIDRDGILILSGGRGEDTSGVSPWQDCAMDISSIVVLQGVELPEDCSGLFALSVYDPLTQQYESRVTSMDLQGLDASRVTTLSGLFRGCTNLEFVNLTGMTTPLVTDFSWMFHGCASLKLAIMDGITTESARTMQGMFYGCESLNEAPVAGFDTRGVTDMSWMFCGCASLTGMDLSLFQTDQVQDMTAMFSLCRALIRLDLSAFRTPSLTACSFMFSGCASLAELDLGRLDTEGAEDLSDFFLDCSSLHRITVPSGFSARLPEGDYVAASSGETLSAAQIAALGTADTYTRAEGDLTN